MFKKALIVLLDLLAFALVILAFAWLLGPFVGWRPALWGWRPVGALPVIGYLVWLSAWLLPASIAAGLTASLLLPVQERS